MSDKELATLINGSDIRGIAVATDEHEANLTATEVKKIANGFLHLLKDKNIGNHPLRIALGFDSRITGPEIKDVLVEIFVQAGVTVLNAGLATTPAMFMATQYEEINADAGIMITASHLPYFYNGLKFFTKEGGAEHEDMEKIIAYSENEWLSSDKGKVEEISLIDSYSKDMVNKIQKATNLDQPLKDFHIVLDAGNGAGGFLQKKS